MWTLCCLFQGVAEELVCRVHIVFGREAAQHQEVAASGFAAVGGYGEMPVVHTLCRWAQCRRPLREPLP